MPTKNNSSAATRKKQRVAVQRRIFFILITIVLIIFSLGAVFGCFICSVFRPAVVNAADETQNIATKMPSPEIEREVEPSILIIESEGQTLDAELQKTMQEMCEKYDVPFALALAVAEQESRFDPDVISMTDDYGIMQINSVNFDWLRAKGIDPLDHKGNIEAGILILSEAIEKHGDYGLALMAYNCGNAGAKRLWDKGIYSTGYSRATIERFNKWTDFLAGA